MYCFNFCHHIFPSIVWFCTIRKKAIHWHSIKKTKLMYEITTRCFLRILIKFLFFDPEWWHQNREMSLFFDCRIRHLTKTKVCTHNQNSMFFKKIYLMTKYQLRSKIGQRLRLLLYKKKQNFPKERNKLQKIWLPLFNMTFNKNMDQLVNDLWSIKCWRENI